MSFKLLKCIYKIRNRVTVAPYFDAHLSRPHEEARERRKRLMKKAISGLLFASVLLGASGGAFAADAQNCTPHKPGYVLDASGKCVKAPSAVPTK
jgi:hypothetical protein